MFGWVYPGLLGVVSKKAASSLRMGLNVGILVHFVEDLFGGGSGWVRGTFTEGTSIPQQQAVHRKFPAGVIMRCDNGQPLSRLQTVFNL